jgi:UDP-N-acetylglucosamine 2-epimerase (non-hydrolysing)
VPSDSYVRATERPEALELGLARLVAEASRLLEDPEAYAAMTTGVNPYGDGRAADRIVDVLASTL